jgi:hypothetical protein
MTAAKVTSDRFIVSILLARRLGEDDLSVPAVLRRAGLPGGFLQQEKIYVSRRELAHHRLKHSTVEPAAVAY